MKLSHVDDAGKARMVDISGKPPMHREAVAAGKINPRLIRFSPPS